MANIIPGKIYKIIGTSNPNSPSIGKKCKALFKFTDRPPHTLWGPIWRVESVDGSTFLDGNGEEGYEVNVAEGWLEDSTEPPKENISEEHALKESMIDNSTMSGRGLLKTIIYID